MTDVGESEASTPVNQPSDARRILYYLRKRSNRAASDDMISEGVFSGNKSRANIAIGSLIKAKAAEYIG